MSRILLIHPPWEFYGDMKDYWNKESRYLPEPLGLLYIAAVLEKHGFDVSLVDMRTKGIFKKHNDFSRLGCIPSDINKIIDKTAPALAGISVIHTAQAKAAHKIAKYLKQANPEIKIVLGGTHPTVAPDLVMKDKSVDYVVIGEGERTFLELSEKIIGGCECEIAKIKNIYYRRNGKVKFSGKGSLITDLDSLPFPARHLINIEDYSRTGSEASVITSRGCPYECIFCSVHQIWGKKWRWRSPENVFEELRMLKKQGVSHIRFVDDNLTMNVERARKLFSLMISKKISMSWSAPNGIRADTLNEELLRLMKEAGCVDIRIGIESGQQHIIDHVIRKKISLKKIEEVVELCKKIGMSIGGFFIIGTPGETLPDIYQTIYFADKLRGKGMKTFSLWITQPTIGTELFEICKENSLLTDDYNPYKISRTNCYINTEDFKREDVENAFKTAKKIFKN